MPIIRKFYKSGYQHLYQISYDKSLLFCTLADKILLFTLICVKSKKYQATITHLCIMLNHFHIQASFYKKEDMEGFMDAVTWAYAVIYNRHFGLHGQVFHRPYGSAPKVRQKKIHENMIYIANNPVVKQAVTSAWDYRWNFLRYAPGLTRDGGIEYSPSSRHPFSEEYDPLEASKEMQQLVKTVRKKAAAGKIIDYKVFSSSRFVALSDKEKSQLIDIIITTYNVIDYGPMLQKYKSAENYCRVLTEIEGNEYELNDDWEREDYRHYTQMFSIAAEEGYDLNVKRYAGVKGAVCLDQKPSQKRKTMQSRFVTRPRDESGGEFMPEEMAERLILRFREEVGATNREIMKFLRITL